LGSPEMTERCRVSIAGRVGKKKRQRKNRDKRRTVTKQEKSTPSDKVYNASRKRGETDRDLPTVSRGGPWGNGKSGAGEGPACTQMFGEGKYEGGGSLV